MRSTIERVCCPKCNSEIKLKHTKETHKVHNGIGMQTVGVDYYSEIVDQDCDCELTLEQEEQLFEK